MLISDKNNLRLFRWLLPASFVMIIYSTLYWVRILYGFFDEFFPLKFMINFILCVMMIFISLFFVKELYVRHISHYILFFSVIIAYAMAIYLVKIPAEKIHFIEYGLLSFLFFRALSTDFKAIYAYIIALILTALVGWGDEVIQYFLPNRFYQNQDVLLNLISGALGLLLTFSWKRVK